MKNLSIKNTLIKIKNVFVKIFTNMMPWLGTIFGAIFGAIFEFIEDSPIFITILGVIVAVIILWNVTSYRDVDYLEKVAPKFIENRGFTITSYDGYSGCPFHGGYVWYQVRDTNNYLYQLSIGDWRGKLMIYNLECLNAVKNQ